MTAEQALVFNDVAAEVHATAHSKGWYDKPETDDEFIARSVGNLHGEVSEIWEAHRNGKLDDPCDKVIEMGRLGITPLSCAEEELADIVIRALDTSKRLGINIGGAIAAKMAFNSHRPYCHGGKRA